MFATPLQAHLQELRVSFRSLGPCLLPGTSVGLGILLGSFLGTFFPPVDLRAQKMHLANRLLLLLAGLLFLSQGQRHPEHHGQGHIHCPHQEAPGTGEGSPSLKVTAGNTAFALRFYHLMASQPYGSNVFSPLSISTAYTMLSLGVCSHSRTQILEGLGFNLTEVSVSDIHRGFQNLLHTLHLPADRLEIRVGSALLLSLELPLLLRFLNDSVTFYESKLFHTNFDDSEGTTQLINNNVREESRGKIVDLISKFSADTMMVLVNYIYFKGKSQFVGGSYIFPFPLIR